MFFSRQNSKKSKQKKFLKRREAKISNIYARDSSRRRRRSSTQTKSTDKDDARIIKSSAENCSPRWVPPGLFSEEGPRDGERIGVYFFFVFVFFRIIIIVVSVRKKNNDRNNRNNAR
jgi:hypothetical protein